LFPLQFHSSFFIRFSMGLALMIGFVPAISLLNLKSQYMEPMLMQYGLGQSTAMISMMVGIIFLIQFYLFSGFECTWNPTFHFGPIPYRKERSSTTFPGHHRPFHIRIGRHFLCPMSFRFIRWPGWMDHCGNCPFGLCIWPSQSQFGNFAYEPNFGGRTFPASGEGKGHTGENII
jgi:hypothetical protein